MSQEALDLENQIRYHSQLYYNQSAPEITDAEFDEMVDRLREINPDSEALKSVGAPIDSEDKVKHESVMGSLSKATWDEEGKISELQKWIDKSPENKGGQGCRLLVTPKMDGAACRLNYENGKLVQAATRGNGEYGQDVTANVRTIDNVPQSVPGFTGEVRGEICMSFETFEQLNEKGLNLANPRNAASGALTAKDVEKTRSRRLDFMAYDVLRVGGKYFCDEEAKLTFLRKEGFAVVPSRRVKDIEIKGVVFDWENVKREKCSYPIDGLVVSYYKTEDQDAVGWASNRPKGRIAWKFRPEQKEAELLDVDWQVGRTGRVTPVARISPTRLAGTTVQNVTLHNWAHFAGMKLRLGATLVVQKANEIIPQVVRQESDGTGSLVPNPVDCPCCGSKLMLDENSVNLWCRDSLCQAKLEARVEHYLKRLDVLGVGSATIHEMCEMGMVKDLPDLYFLDVRKLQTITGGSTSAQNVYTAILSKCEIPLAQFLSSLGIHGLGRTTSKEIAKKFFTLENVRELSLVRVSSIDGIGPKSGKAIIDGLDSMSETIDKLLEVIEVLDVEESTGPLAGFSFCLTGSMSRSRKDIAADIEAAGGTVKSSVGKGLHYLVQADPTSESSKSKKARKLGTEVIGEEQLTEMIK